MGERKIVSVCAYLLGWRVRESSVLYLHIERENACKNVWGRGYERVTERERELRQRKTCVCVCRMSDRELSVRETRGRERER
jgi:hypothetical protein